MRSNKCLSSLVLVLAVLTSGPAQAQSAGASEQIHVNLKTAATPPGTEFSTPLYVVTASDVKLRTLTVQVSYPKGVFSFSRSEKGILLQGGRFEVETASAPHARNSKLETLKVVVKADPDDAKAALPKGLLLYLHFAVSENAEPAPITLQTEVVAADAVDGTPLSKARWAAEDQVITVVGSDMKSILACFFYMH